jgi:hypothetical protein
MMIQTESFRQTDYPFISNLKRIVSISEGNSMIEKKKAIFNKCQLLVRKTVFFEKVNLHIFLKFNDIFICTVSSRYKLQLYLQMMEILRNS